MVEGGGGGGGRQRQWEAAAEVAAVDIDGGEQCGKSYLLALSHIIEAKIAKTK